MNRVFLIFTVLFPFAAWAGIEQVIGELKQEKHPTSFQVSLPFGGMNRSYRLFVPKNFHWGSPLPLMISMHGAFGNSGQHESMTHFSETAHQMGFLLIEPDGTRLRRVPEDVPLTLAWNAGVCCGTPAEEKIDDVGFIRALLKTLPADFVDPAHVYASGFSNGAMMAHRLGCELGDKLAGFAAVAGTLADVERGPNQKPAFVCQPKKKMPVLLIHGENDKCVTFEGGPAECFSNGTRRRAIYDALSVWSQHNGCSQFSETFLRGLKPTITRGKAAFIVNPTCPAPAPVALWSIKELGHVWPTSEIIASVEIWKFLSSR